MTQPVAQTRNVVARSGFANPLTLGVLVTSIDYLEVYADDDILSEGTDYVVTGLGDPLGVEIEIIGAEDVDEYVGVETFTAVFVPPVIQDADLGAGGPFGQAFENAIDAIVRIIASIFDRTKRSIKMPIDVEGDIVLPTPVDGYMIGWDADAQDLVWLPQAPQGIQGIQGEQGAPGADGADGIMSSVVAGYGMDVDSTDPANPIVIFDPTEVFTASVTEINYMAGVTSSVQTQLNTKASVGLSIAIALVLGG